MTIFWFQQSDAQCSYVSYVPSTYYDVYTCCYKFTSDNTAFSPPSTYILNTAIDPQNPIIYKNGGNLGSTANGNTLYYEVYNGYYTSGYYDSNGIYRSNIQLYYIKYTNNTVYVYQNTMQSSDGSLTTTLAGKNAMIWFYVGGLLSCARFNFAGAAAAGSSQTQAGAVGFNGNTSGCTASVPYTAYLVNVTNSQSVQTPNVTLSYNASTGKMDVSVTAWYIPQYATYSIRFSPFNVSSDDVNLTSTCENRVASSYTGISFSNWWTHLPNAIINNALGTLSNLAYGPANGWNFFFVDCSRVTWMQSFSMSSLGSCKTSSGAKEVNVNDQSTLSGYVTYSGQLYINLISPIFSGYGTGSKAGYTCLSWQYPFQYTFQSTSVATTLVSAGGSYLTVNIISISIISSGPDVGKMYIALQTTYYPDQYGYIVNATLSSTTGANLIMSGTPSTLIQSTPAVQNFAWISSTNQSVYDGTYTFSFPTYNCPGLSNASLCIFNGLKSQPILVYLRQQVTSTAKTTLSSFITIFNDNTFKTPQSSIFTEGNPICFKDTIAVALEDQSLFSISINNAYICSPNTANAGLFYDGITNFGCRNTTIFSKIVSGGSVLAGSIGPNTVGYYNPVLYTLTRSIDTGVCINAQARIMTADGTLWPVSQQFIQIELSVSLLGQTLGSYVKLIKTSQTTGSIGVVRDDSPDNSDSSSPSNSNTNLDDNSNNNNTPTSSPAYGDGGNDNSSPQNSDQKTEATNSFVVRKSYAVPPTTPSPPVTPPTPAPDENTINYGNNTYITMSECRMMIRNGTFFNKSHHHWNQTDSCIKHPYWSAEHIDNFFVYLIACCIICLFLGYNFRKRIQYKSEEAQFAGTKHN